jgi:hypothetical protein
MVVSGEWQIRQSEGNKTANRLSAADLIAIRAVVRENCARWGDIRARPGSQLLKTTLQKNPRRMCSSQSIAVLLGGSNQMNVKYRWIVAVSQFISDWNLRQDAMASRCKCVQHRRSSTLAIT